VRPATLARFGLGSACLLAPDEVLDVVGGADRHDATTQIAARVLGGRLLLHAVADVALGRRTRGIGTVVELSHAASMLPVAARWPAHRRTALVSAMAASTIAILDLRRAET
jgi:hypothetical protein